MKDAMTYAHEAGFFSFNVVGWKIEFERLIASIRAEYEVPLKLAEEALQHYRIKWAGEDTTPAHTRKALAAIREALADHIPDATKMVADPVKRPQNCGTGYCSCIECPYEPVKREPVVQTCPACGSDYWDGRSYAEPVQEPVTVEASEKMGATGAAPTESERQLFEAWMRGHCWAISGVWDGKTYVDSAETGGYINPLTMHVRCLWAAWRDRAALGAPVQPVKQEPVIPAFLRRPGSFSHE